jgi:anti-anti-sigma factor
MEVKINTKEKFHVITVPTATLSADMTEELPDQLLAFLQNDVKNIVLDLNQVRSLDNISAERLVKVQQKFYENNASFVIFGLQPSVEEFLEKQSLLEIMNITPTESEAWDIVQMEEIERELMNDESL